MSSDRWRLGTRHADSIENGDLPMRPELVFQFDGDYETLIDQLPNTGTGGDYPEEIDVTFQLHSAVDDSDRGTLALSDRTTGEYLIEMEVSANRIFEFVLSVHQYADKVGNEGEYGVTFEAENGTAMEYIVEPLLVYQMDGELYRSRSLIPTWVEE